MTSPTAGMVLSALAGDGEDWQVRVYDRARRRLGLVGAPSQLVAHGRWLGISTAVMEVPLDHPRSAALRQPGARVEIDWRGQLLVGGRSRFESDDESGSPALRVHVTDWMGLLEEALAWPVPTAAITAQTREHDVRVGPVETVVKGLVAAAFTRLGLPVAVAPDRGRGPRVRVEARMDPLLELVRPLLERAGLGLTIRPTGPEHQRTGLVLDTPAPPAWRGLPLTSRSGVVRSSVVGLVRPSATRVVVMGGGEGADRDMRYYVDDAREREHEVVAEVVVDARDARSDLDGAQRDVDQAADRFTRTREAFLEARADERAAVADARLDLLEAQRRRDEVHADGSSSPAQRDSASQAVQRAATRLAEVRTTQAERVATARTEHEEAIRARDAAVTVRDTERAAYAAELDERGAQALADGGPRASAAVRIGETGSFRFARGDVQLGTALPLVLPGEVRITERLREVHASWGGQEPVPTLVLGQRDDDPDVRLVRAVGRLTAAVRKTTRR